jgi:hypothetical protein
MGDSVTLAYLRNWRRRQLMTVRMLSEKLTELGTPVCESTLQRVERMDISTKLVTVHKIAEGLGITPEQLVYTDPGELPYKRITAKRAHKKPLEKP